MSAHAELMLQLPEGVQRTFFYRAESIGDRGVIQQIFQSADYDIKPFKQHEALLRFLSAQLNGGRRPLIIDAGANIGASSVFFATQFPQGRIVAIEPEKGNVEMLRRNCAGLDVVVREAALGAEVGTAFLSDPGHSDWGFRVGSSGEHAVSVATVADILADPDQAQCFPLVCKIDIEGGEATLFAKNTEWVDQFVLIIIELHDWLFPGQGTSRNFLRAIAACDFDFLYRGENVFCFNNRLLKDA